MNHKVIAIVALSAALAISGGVVAATSENIKTKPSTAKPTIVETAPADVDGTQNGEGNYVDPDDTVDMTDENGLPVTEPEEQPTEPLELPTDYESEVEPSESYEKQLITASMTVKYVVDHSTGAQVSPRVVFGAAYTYCFAAFNEDGSFEICLDPTSGAIRKGTYAIYGKVVSVVYSDGVGSEYELLTDETGKITHIIVNYGDYDVYFGVTE